MPSEAARPYFDKKIIELEALFRRSQAKIEVLEALDHELSHRKTKKTSQLRYTTDRCPADLEPAGDLGFGDAGAM